MKTLNKFKKGFTLVELIIVIAIIAILAAAIFVAVDPARRFNEARNSTRYTDVVNILDTLLKYQADNDGTHYGEIDSSHASALANGEYAMIGTGTSSASCRDSNASGFYDTVAELCAGSDEDSNDTPADCIDLSEMGSNYLPSVPKDPTSTGTDANTQYYVMRDSNGALTVGACDEEGEDAGGTGTPPTIEVTR